MSPPNDPHPVGQTREEASRREILEMQQLVASLSDEQLALSTAYLSERVEAMLIDIEDYRRGNTPRAATWLRRAGWALARSRSQLATCEREATLRKAERHTARMEEQQRAKAARREEVNSGRQELFVSHARRLLPQHIYQQIWEAVRTDPAYRPDKGEIAA